MTHNAENATSTCHNWAAQLLAPWCTFLKRDATMTLRPSTNGLCIYVKFQPQAAGALPAQSIASCREALLLLHVLAAVDNSAFQHVLLSACACANLPLVVPAELAARFELRLGDSKDDAVPGFDTELYRSFFALPSRNDSPPVSATFASRPSNAFADAMDAINGRATSTQQSRLSDPCIVHVRLIPPRRLETERVVQYLESVLALVQALELELGASCTSQPDNTAAQLHTRLVPFALERLELHVGRLTLAPAASMLLAQLLERKQLRVELYPSIGLCATAAVGRLPPVKLAHVLCAVTRDSNGSNGLISSGNSNVSNISNDVTTAVAPPRLTRVDFSSESSCTSTRERCKYMQNVRALCSALTASSTVDALHIEDLVAGAPLDCTRECWQWLSYALLSKDSTSSVSSLTIHDRFFRRQDARAILRLLEATNPAAVLHRSQCDREQSDCDDSNDYDSAGDDDGDGNSGDDQDAYPASLAQRHEQLDAHQIFGSAMMSRIDDEYSGLAFRGDNDSDGSDGAASDASSEQQHDVPRIESEPISVRVLQGAVARFCGSKRSQLSLPLDASVALRVMRDGTSYDDDDATSTVDVIVPGIGQCSVTREAVDCIVSCSSADPTFTAAAEPLSSLALGYRGPISSLTLCFARPTDGAVLLPLLAYMGQQLTTLDLASEVALTAASLRAILCACPRLATLAIPDVLGTAERELLAAYEQERCVVSDLSIVQFEPSEDTVELLRCLSDPTHRIAQCMRRLTLVPSELSAFPSATAAMFVRLLARNKTLERLQVRLSRDVAATLEQELMRFHGERLPVVKAPLSLASRVALMNVLSALAHNDDAQPPRKQARRKHDSTTIRLERVSSDVLALIFDFAAERAVREVDVSVL